MATFQGQFRDNAHEIIPDFLWLGSEDAGTAPLTEMQEIGVTHVLIPAYTGNYPIIYPEHLHYMHLNLRDVKGVGILPEFPLAFAFIGHCKAQGGKVLVHCAQGISRSASFVVGYIMKERKCTYEEANNHVRKIRAVVDTEKKFGDQLTLWAEMGYEYEGDSPAHQKCRKEYKKTTISRSADVIPVFLNQ